MTFEEANKIISSLETILGKFHCSSEFALCIKDLKGNYAFLTRRGSDNDVLFELERTYENHSGYNIGQTINIEE